MSISKPVSFEELLRVTKEAAHESLRWRVDESSIERGRDGLEIWKFDDDMSDCEWVNYSGEKLRKFFRIFSEEKCR